MPDARIPAPEPTPAEAFSALPLETPERSAWPLLAARWSGVRPGSDSATSSCCTRAS